MGVIENLAEQVAVVGTVDPGSLSAAAHTTDIVDMRLVQEAMFIVLAGTLGSGATLDFLVKGSASSDMSSPGNLTGKAITQFTQAGSDSNKQAIVRVSADEVAEQGYRYIQGTMTIGTAASGAAVVVLASGLTYSDARDYDLSSVDEVVM